MQELQSISAIFPRRTAILRGARATKLRQDIKLR
jgi:hypothetical protein